MKYVVIALAMLLGAVLPRRPIAVARSAAWLLVPLIALAVCFVVGTQLWIAAAAIGGSALLGTVLLNEPRIELVPLNFVAAALCIVIASGPPTSKAEAIATLTTAAVLAVASGIRRPWALRILCALVAACVAAKLLPWNGRWTFAGAWLVVMIASWAFTPPERPTSSLLFKPDPPRHGSAGLTVALVLTSAVLLLPALATPLPERAPEPYGTRIQALLARAPAGGLVWPHPSEAILWDAAESFPALDREDSIYLTGQPIWLARVGNGSWFRQKVSLHNNIATLRRIKDESELVELRAAAHATVESLKDVLALYRPGGGEGNVAAALHQRFLARGCERESFPSVVGAGAHGASPHYFENDGGFTAGEMVVTDIGCDHHFYAADFTRTIPVGGHFTPEQRRFYDAVYAAQQAALAACRPGVQLAGTGKPGEPTLEDISRATLKDAGVEYQYPHGLGHGVGLFAHDVMTPDRLLAAGMVVTIEPGLYLPGNLGIRIEDTYLVTDAGCVAITTGFPADSASVEARVQAALADAGFLETTAPQPISAPNVAPVAAPPDAGVQSRQSLDGGTLGMRPETSPDAGSIRVVRAWAALHRNDGGMSPGPAVIFGGGAGSSHRAIKPSTDGGVAHRPPADAGHP